MRYAIVCVLLAALSVGAQTVNVIELEPADTARAQKAWDALQKAQAEWDAVHKSVEMKYTTRPVNTGGGGMCVITTDYCYIEGFSYGFEFSKDFKHIVPKPAGPHVDTFSIQQPHCANGICW